METGYTIADRYVCKKLLGKGGSGSVYMVYDMKLDKNWAVKLCHGGRPEEAAALKRIDCSAFPRIVDVIHQDDTEAQGDFLAEKIVNLRVFEDEAGKMKKVPDSRPKSNTEIFC